MSYRFAPRGPLARHALHLTSAALLVACGTGVPGVPDDAYTVQLRHGHFGGPPGLATLRRDIVIQGIPCRGGGRVSFSRQGELESCFLSRPYAIPGRTLAAGTDVTLAREPVEGGRRVSELRSPVAETFAGAVFAPMSEVQVREDGTVRQIRLVEAQTFKGTLYPAATTLEFNEGGPLRGVLPPRSWTAPSASSARP